jgi:hypothetical protein
MRKLAYLMLSCILMNLLLGCNKGCKLARATTSKQAKD